MFKWEDKIDKPMNENAEADFKEAIEEAKRKTEEAVEKSERADFEKAFEKAVEAVNDGFGTALNPNDFPYVSITETEHKNKAVLEWRVNGAWQDFISILLLNGYDVEIRHTYDGDLYSTEAIEISWGDK